MIQRTQGIIVQ